MFNRRSPHLRENIEVFHVPSLVNRLETSFRSNMSCFGMVFNSIKWNLVLALLIRLAFMLYGIWQDATMRVKYTDVDYLVFTDAAYHVSQGASPYKRATYRYTPLLAWMLLPNVTWSPYFGKVLFIVFDVMVGYLIYLIVLRKNLNENAAVRCAQTWLLNPLPITVSSRGNAESLMAALVLLTLNLMQIKTMLSTALAFIVFAVSVHFKIYPVIYGLPLYLVLNEEFTGWKSYWRMFRCDVWPNATRITMFALAGLVFILLTRAMYQMYGDEFLQETYLYHLTRKDTRHNFSVYFYMLYLSEGGAWSKVISLLSFLPQAILILVSSFKYYNDLPFCCFLNTFIFVTFNKVVTSQYFLWYLSILPVVMPQVFMPLTEAGFLLGIWFAGQGLWLLPAYYLEFEGRNTFIFIWLASIVFLLINIFIMCRIVVSYVPHFQPLMSSPLKRMSLSEFRRLKKIK